MLSPLRALPILLAIAASSGAIAQTFGYIENENSITAFDTSTGAITNTFDLEISGIEAQLAVSPDGSTLYVPGYFNLKEAILVVSAHSGAVLDTIAVQDQSEKVVVSGDGLWAYVICGAGGEYGSVAVVSLSSMSVTGVITVVSGDFPTDIALSKDGSTLYVSATPGILTKARQAANTPAGVTLLECPITAGTCVIDTASITLKSMIADVHGFLSLSQNGKYLYVNSRSNGTLPPLLAVNTNTHQVSLIKLPSGTFVYNVFVSPVGSDALVLTTPVTDGAPATPGFILDTVTNQVRASFPVAKCGGVPIDQGQFAAFTPTGKAIWMVHSEGFGSGCPSPDFLAGQAFPGGSTIAEVTLQNSAGFIAIQP